MLATVGKCKTWTLDSKSQNLLSYPAIASWFLPSLMRSAIPVIHSEQERNLIFLKIQKLQGNTKISAAQVGYGVAQYLATLTPLTNSILKSTSPLVTSLTNGYHSLMRSGLTITSVPCSDPVHKFYTEINITFSDFIRTTGYHSLMRSLVRFDYHFSSMFRLCQPLVRQGSAASMQTSRNLNLKQELDKHYSRVYLSWLPLWEWLNRIEVIYSKNIRLKFQGTTINCNTQSPRRHTECQCFKLCTT